MQEQQRRTFSVDLDSEPRAIGQENCLQRMVGRGMHQGAAVACV